MIRHRQKGDELKFQFRAAANPQASQKNTVEMSANMPATLRGAKQNRWRFRTVSQLLVGTRCDRGNAKVTRRVAEYRDASETLRADLLDSNAREQCLTDPTVLSDQPAGSSLTANTKRYLATAEVCCDNSRSSTAARLARYFSWARRGVNPTLSEQLAPADASAALRGALVPRG